jgi:cytochrome c oxidase subunit 2
VTVIASQWYWTYEQLEEKLYLGIGEIDMHNHEYVAKESYMIATTELKKGDLRLLEVDNPLIIEIKKHIRFIITATVVLHSFAVPSLGIKVDSVPGRLNQIGSFITREGVFYGQCSELCGVNHGFMPIKIIAKKTLG